MKKLLMPFLLFGLLFGLLSGCSVNEPPITSETIARSFSASTIASGDTLTVTLTKTLSADQTTILIEENFPEGWIIVDAGTGIVSGNVIKWAELTGAKSGTYTYTIKAASGAAAWTGKYSINGQTPILIGGSESVTVQ